MTGVNDASFNLPRSLAEEHRYDDALVAYRRALASFEARGDVDAIIAAKVETFLVLIDADAPFEASEAYAELLELLDRYERELSEFDALMFPLYLRAAHGATDGIVEEMEGYLTDYEGGVPLGEVVTMMAFGASVHERNGSPLQGARLLVEIAEMYEGVVLEHDEQALGAEVARAYWDHAQFLARTRDQCVFEAEAIFGLGREGVDADEWHAFLVATLDDFETVDSIDAAVSARIMKSLDASDEWGPATSTLRSLVGRCRVLTLLHDHRHNAALAEARRVIPIAERAGDHEGAGALLRITDLLARGNDGPDLDGFGFGI